MSAKRRRRIEIGTPLLPASTITRRRFLAGTGVILTSPAALALANTSTAIAASPPRANVTRLRVRLLDAHSTQPTSAMVCISDAQSGQVRLPPDGRICSKPSTVQEFYSGVRFSPDPNWIGPVRKMQGRGDNNDRSYVYEDRPSIPFWKEPMIYQTSGDFQIDLPAGRWRLQASHGMEFVPVNALFETNGQGEIIKDLTLQRWIDLPSLGWWSGDVHVHHPTTEPAQREFLIQYARAEDVHLVNLLEMGHHTGTEFHQAGFGRAFRVQRGDFALVSGQEDPRSTFGHIIGLNLQAIVRDTSTYDLYDQTFRGIHAQEGALVGFAHFSWNGCDLPRGFPWYVTSGELDFVELLQFGLLNRADYADYLNLGFRLTAAAGSDTPWGSTIGEVRTFVHTGRSFDVDQWFANLKAGHTFVSNGPALFFTVDGALPGAELTPKPGAQVTVHARAVGHPQVGLPTRLRIEGPDGTLKEAKGAAGGPELTAQFEHKTQTSQWLMASVECDNGAVAHTTPVYLSIDGRPTWSVRLGPAIIEKQTRAIDKISLELQSAKPPHPLRPEILDRLRRASEFYQNLRRSMERSG